MTDHLSGRLRRLTLAALLALSATVGAACGGDDSKSAADVPEGSVAVVGEVDVTKAQLDELMAQAKASYTKEKRDYPKVGTAEYTQLQQQALQYLVSQAQLSAGAESLDVQVSAADIDKGVEELKAQVAPGKDGKGFDAAAYEKVLKEQNLSVEQVRDQVEQRELAKRIYDKVTVDIKVDDAAVTKYYNANKKTLYTTPDSRHVRHILVKKKALADQLYSQLAEDDSQFAALAKKNSEDPGSKENGGDLTDVQRNQTVPEFDKVVFSIETKVVSKPVKTQYGFHIIEALEPIKKAGAKPLDAALKTQISQQLQKTQKDKAAEKWFADLQKDLKEQTEYAEGFAPVEKPADPGATGTGGGTQPAPTTTS